MTRNVERSKMTEQEKQAARETKWKNRLNSLKNEFERGSIVEFDQIFAIISETRFAEELGISFYTFRNKVNDPRAFTVMEMMRLAELIGVEYDIISAFVVGEIRQKEKE